MNSKTSANESRFSISGSFNGCLAKKGVEAGAGGNAGILYAGGQPGFVVAGSGNRGSLAWVLVADVVTYVRYGQQNRKSTQIYANRDPIHGVWSRLSSTSLIFVS